NDLFSIRLETGESRSGAHLEAIPAVGEESGDSDVIGARIEGPSEGRAEVQMRPVNVSGAREQRPGRRVKWTDGREFLEGEAAVCDPARRLERVGPGLGDLHLVHVLRRRIEDRPLSVAADRQDIRRSGRLVRLELRRESDREGYRGRTRAQHRDT